MTIYLKYLKHPLDFIASATGLVLLSPLLIAIAFKIKREDGGSVFYRGLRVGRNGVIFKIYKFRTMIMDAEIIGGSSTSNEDTRITNTGAFLRKHKLDELPQLINVLKGEMSMIGPRPEVQEYTDMYEEDDMRILSVRPGLTDWASIWNPNEGAVLVKYPDPDKAYLEIIRPRKLELQKKYVDELSISNDLKILLMTIWMVISKKEGELETSIREERSFDS